MTIQMLKGKIHRATVVQAALDYVGSITVDEELLEAADILEYEKVQIVDVDNGERFWTYTIAGERGTGMTIPTSRYRHTTPSRSPVVGKILLPFCFLQSEGNIR